MEFYAQILWTIVISIFTIYLILTKIILKYFDFSNDSNNNEQKVVDEEEHVHQSKKNEVVDTGGDDNDEVLFKCKVEDKNVEVLKAIILSERADASDKWQLTAVRKITEHNSDKKNKTAVEVSCVLCAGDKCKMIKKIVVLHNMTVLSKEEYRNIIDVSGGNNSANISSENKEQKNVSLEEESTTPGGGE